MEIVFSINNNAEIMVMPAAPEFEIAEAQGNDTFQGLTVNIRMIGNKELRTMSLSSYFKPGICRPGSTNPGRSRRDTGNLTGYRVHSRDLLMIRFIT